MLAEFRQLPKFGTLSVVNSHVFKGYDWPASCAERELLPVASLAFPRFGWYEVLKAEPHELSDETRT